jgi:branched-chain amino acid transport system substrate-binding protein
MKVHRLPAMMAGVAFLGLCYGPLSATDAFAQARPYKFGVAVDLTGKFTSYGRPAKEGVDFAIAKWRKFKGGKVAGRPLEVIMKDTQSGAQPTISAFMEFIQSDKIDILMGPTASGLVASAVPIWKQAADRPIWVEPGGTSLKVQELIGDDEYFFHTHGWSTSYTSAVAKALVKLVEPDQRKVGLIYSDGAYGRSILPEVKRYFADAKIPVSGEELMREGATDLTAPIAKLRQTKPDVVFALVQTDDAIQLTKQLYQRKFGAAVQIGLAQVPLKEWQDAVGPAQNCWIGTVAWLPDLTYPADKREPAFFPSAADWEADFKKTYGHDAEYIAVDHYVSVILALLAADQVGGEAKRDDVKARLALSDYDTPFGAAKFAPMGATKYQAFGDMLVFQRQKRGLQFENVVVYPDNIAAGKLEKCP